MNNYFNKLFSINNYFSISHHFTEENGFVAIDKSKHKKFANICLVNRSCYWHAKKDYSNINLIELPKLIKAEIKQIAPFEGDIFWQIERLTIQGAIVHYYVIPNQIIDSIRPKCQFIFPESNGSNSLLLSLNEGVSSESVISAEQLGMKNIFSLCGLFIKKARDEKVIVQKLTNKMLFLLASISIVSFVLLSSVYLSLYQSYYQDATLANKSAVENALKVQREVKARYQSKKDFDEFIADNPNVLSLFSSLDLSGYTYEINKVHLHPKGVKITGTTSQSATDILARLIQESVVKEAKFSRPVSKNRAGDEVFVIEVIFS
ncbi:hypothetical protein [Litorilituus sediminis]|uniref:Fimbrial assembly protein n=1 Tax=Litorilituus sediminis TaxID=718192 RepID=A0A4V0ZFX3_9GAMM|nr:hypothetical protein [Litorilituus sediminis]QBG35300.1 hypothetical protein EMK97_05985 [Litorilituus sediminis]